MKAVDWAGQTIDFQMPLAFISAATAGSTVNAYDPSRPPGSAGDPYDIIQGYAGDPRAVVDLKGQKLTYAEPAAGSSNTRHSTKSFTFGAALPDPSVSETQLIGADQPAWYPQWSTAEVEITGLSELAGASGASTISPNADYLANGYSEANAAEVFADILTALAIVFGSGSGGGVATPNFGPTGLSRQLGPLADAASFLTGKFDPLSYFGDDAMILGGISLGQIIKQVVGEGLLSSAPNITVQEVNDPKTNLPTSFIVSYTLKRDRAVQPAR